MDGTPPVDLVPTCRQSALALQCNTLTPELEDQKITNYDISCQMLLKISLKSDNLAKNEVKLGKCRQSIQKHNVDH